MNNKSLTNITAARNSLVDANGARNIYTKTFLAKELVKLKDKPSDFFIGFIRGIDKASNHSQQNPSRDYLFGLNAAYEYREKSNKTDEIVPDVTTDIENIVANTQNKSDKYLSAFEDLRSTKQDEFNAFMATIEDNQAKRVASHDEFITASKNSINELEVTYGEKLKLSKPAEYWASLHNSYNRNGIIWFCVVGATTLISIALLTFIVISANAFDEDSWIVTLRNTAILSIIVAAIMYLLRTVTKVALSSFHLARDAKEREQLAYFYLALLKDSAISEKERELVLSALFSRSDTGLLKGDSSPEMPSVYNIGDQLKSNK
jgi:hypothetical protein